MLRFICVQDGILGVGKEERPEKTEAEVCILRPAFWGKWLSF